MKKIAPSVQIAASYIGVIIGAGFASGQELLLFFALYQWRGLLGVLVATILFILLGSFILVASGYLRVRSYADLLEALVKPWFIRIFDVCSSLMLLVGTGIMIVGSGVVVKEFVGISEVWGMAIMYAAVAFVAWGGKDRVNLVNALLIPVLFVCTAFFCLKVLGLENRPEYAHVLISPAGGNWFIASLLYVSYNLLAGFVVLSSICTHDDMKANLWGGLLGGVGLGCLAALIVLAEVAVLPHAAQYQAPMLYICSFSGPWAKKVYAFVLCIAMFTTAIGNVLGLTQRFAQIFRVSQRLVVIIALAGTLPLLPFAFSDLIRYLYQFFGYLGLLLMLVLAASVSCKRVWGNFKRWYYG